MVCKRKLYTFSDIKKHLDSCITFWRNQFATAKQRGNMGDMEVMATNYIDVYQSIRMNIFGVELDDDQGGWIGVDLDGTLAEYRGWQGIEHIGKPVPKMVERIKKWISEGIRVKIVTARVGHDDSQMNRRAEKVILTWLVGAGLPELEVTNKKDFNMAELWDDRAVPVESNTGKVLLKGGNE